MTEQLPQWAAALREERERRGWSKPRMARELLTAIGVPDRPVESLVRQMRGWESGKHFPRDWMSVYATAFGITEQTLFGTTVTAPQTVTAAPAVQRPRHIAESLVSEALDLAAWAEQTNVGNTTIDFLGDATRRVAADYLRKAPVPVLSEAADLYRRTAQLLRSGRQHLSQQRDLFVIAGQLLAFLSWASSDLGQPHAADAYATTALIMGGQADHNGVRALALIARSKNAFWEQRLHEAADHARRGLEYAPASSTRVLLACKVGDASQALGDVQQARAAHELAQRARDEIVERSQSGEPTRQGDPNSDEMIVGPILGFGVADQTRHPLRKKTLAPHTELLEPGVGADQTWPSQGCHHRRVVPSTLGGLRKDGGRSTALQP